MNATLQYSGKVEKGQLKVVHRHQFDTDLVAFEGKEVSISISRKRKVRSDAMNRYYWGCMVKMIVQGLKDMGDRVMLSAHDEWMRDLLQNINPQMAHDFLKGKFIDQIVIDEETGEVTNVKASTKQMTNTEFIEYYTPIYQWARVFLNIEIPLPDPDYKYNQQQA